MTAVLGLGACMETRLAGGWALVAGLLLAAAGCRWCLVAACCWALAAPAAGGCWLSAEVLSAGHRGRLEADWLSAVINAVVLCYFVLLCYCFICN